MVAVIKPYVALVLALMSSVDAQQTAALASQQAITSVEVTAPSAATTAVVVPAAVVPAPVVVPAIAPAPATAPAVVAPVASTANVAAPATVVAPTTATQPTIATPGALKVGDYFRPTGAQVSGVPGATTPYVRSPCPALNTLANHGFFPRDGKNIPKKVFAQVLMEVFNLDSGLANFHATLLKATGNNLSDLGKHNFIEHDFSVVHSDSFYQGDPSAVDLNFAADLLGRAQGGMLGVQQFAEASKSRMATCNAKPTGCKLSGFHRSLAFREQASILRVFGGTNSETCRVDFAQSFLVDERIPNGWQKPLVQVKLADLSATGTKIERTMRTA